MTVSLKTFVASFEKSAYAALTKDAQDEERKKIRPTDSCVKISTNKDSVLFESSSQKMSVFHSMDKDENMTVDEDGSFCVEASGYLSILNSIPKDYSLKISYEVDKNYGKDSFAGIVQPNGKIITIGSGNKTEKRKGKSDTYPIDDFPKIDYSGDKVLFSIKAKTLRECVDKVIFATDSTDLSGLLDRVAIYVFEKKLYFAGTDGKRCAIYSPDKDVEVNCDDQKILIDGELLKTSCKVFEGDDKILFYDCKKGEHVILSSGKTLVKVCIASEEVKQQFPNVMGILKLVCPTTIVANKSDLLSSIDFLSKFNAEKSIFHINEGKSQIKVEAARRGEDPENALVDCETVATALSKPVAMSNGFVIDGCKKIKGDMVKLGFSKDEKKIKMESTNDTNFVYLMQVMTANWL